MEQNLGRYLIEEQLGEGSFAYVYRALDQELERNVALKVLKPAWLSDPAAIARFKQEARTMAKLDKNPHIAMVYEVGEDEGQVYLAQFLVDGETLAARLTRGPLAWSEALDILRPIASALDYAHGQGIVHRDIKPTNILLSKDGQAYLSDFGLVRAAEGSVSLSASIGGVKGTAAYIPPEVWDEVEEVTPAADIYALSCVIFEMLTGKVLFEGSSMMAVMRRHDKGPQFPATWPKGVPAGVTGVLQRGLAADPAERFSSAGELVAALEALPAQRRPSKRLLAGGGIALVGGAVVLVVIVGAILFFVFGEGAAPVAQATDTPVSEATPTVDTKATIKAAVETVAKVTAEAEAAEAEVEADAAAARAAATATATAEAAVPAEGEMAGGKKTYEDLTVCYPQLGAESDWRTANSASLKQTAEELGVNLIFSDAQQKQENQISAMRTCIQQGVDVIALPPVVEDGWDAVLVEAKDASIPVIIVDRSVSTDESLYAAHIGSDMVLEGQRSADEMNKLLPDGGKIVELSGTTGSRAAVGRAIGFRMNLNDNIEIIDTQDGNFTTAGGKPVMEAFLKKYEGEIDGAFIHNDNMAIGAVEAMKAAGVEPGDIKIVSIDGTRGGFQLMIDGWVQADVECNPELGPQVMEMALALANGESVERETPTNETVYYPDEAVELLPTRKY